MHEFREFQDLLYSIDVCAFNGTDIREAVEFFRLIGITTNNEDFPIFVAEKTLEGVRLIKIPQHIHKYLMDHGRQIHLPQTITFIHDTGAIENVTDTREFLKRVREHYLYSGHNNVAQAAVIPETQNNNQQENIDAQRDIKDPRKDSGYETDQNPEDRHNHEQPDDDKSTEEDIQNNNWETNKEPREPTANRYYKGAYTSRRDRYRDNHDEIAINETQKYIDEGRTKKEIYTPGFSDEDRLRRQHRIRDIARGEDNRFSECKQCRRETEDTGHGHTGNELGRGAHHRSMVRVLVLEHDNILSTPIEITQFETTNFTITNAYHSKRDWIAYGRDAYWQDIKFHKAIIKDAENKLIESFPLKTYRELKIKVRLEPVCVSYNTLGTMQYVMPIHTMDDRMTEAPEPTHLFINTKEPGSYDAEYYVTFICKIDAQPAIDLQVTAAEDELVQRLREIMSDNHAHNYFSNFGKLIVAYAHFQDRKHDSKFQHNWTPGNKAQPVEELLDLRTQLDIKRQRDRYHSHNDYYSRPTTSNYHLRKGMQNRRQRMNERYNNIYRYREETGHGNKQSWKQRDGYKPIPTPRVNIHKQASTTTNEQTYTDWKKVQPIRIKREKKSPTPNQNQDSKKPEYTWRIYGENDKKKQPETQNDNNKANDEKKRRTRRQQRKQ